LLIGKKFSSLFVKNETLYKYGGYGYWTASNVISYLDPISKGWELIPYNEESPIRISSHSKALLCVENTRNSHSH
jgi:hypothetical protein